MKATYLIPAANLEPLRAEVEKLNRRARRIGVAEIALATAPAFLEYEIGCGDFKPVWMADHEVVFTADDSGRERRELGAPRNLEATIAEYSRRAGRPLAKTGRVREWLALTVEGESPKFAGWEFIGSLSPVPVENGPPENEVRATPGNSIPAEYRRRVGECDHCRTIRRRTETFVVRHENGDHRMVGRNCIKDFLGHSDPHSLAAWAELLSAFDRLARGAADEDWGGGGGRAPELYELEDFLTVTSALVRRDGWLSRTAARERYDGPPATADDVLRYYHPPTYGGNEAMRDWRAWRDERTPTEKDAERAAAAAAWAKGLSEDGEGLEDYLYNVNLIARSGLVRAKSVGLAASIIAAYDREIERRARAERRGESHHVGEIGKRMELTVTLHKVVTIDGWEYTSYLHIMSDAEGNDIKWFASNPSDFEIGETYKVNATPKKYDDYKGRPCTVVTRVALAKEKPARKPRGKKAKAAEAPAPETPSW